MKPHILICSNDLAISHGFPDNRHIEVNDGRKSAILNIVDLKSFRAYPLPIPHILFYNNALTTVQITFMAMHTTHTAPRLCRTPALTGVAKVGFAIALQTTCVNTSLTPISLLCAEGLVIYYPFKAGGK